MILRTNDEDKDTNTGVTVAIDGLATWSQSGNERYDDWSTHTGKLSPPWVRLSDLAGRYISVCMKPNGNDTWKFNLHLQGTRSDGQLYDFDRDNVFLSTDVPCLSWDATPAPLPDCGALGQPCCLASAPCKASYACSRGVCTQDPVTISHLQVALETSNEDKDDNTKVFVEGVATWSQATDLKYDDWSVHRWDLMPSSVALSTLEARNIAIRTIPDGDDSWKFNFRLEGTRSDGGYYEFRKDNVWLSNDGNDALHTSWQLGPPPLDLQWNASDLNGLPLNPVWRGYAQADLRQADCDQKCLDATKACPFHPSPLISNDLLGLGLTGSTANDWGRCTSQSPTYDRSIQCGWHINWFPATFEGTAAWDMRSNGTINTVNLLDDEDYNINLSPLDSASNVGNGYIHTEFDFGETVAQFSTQWWSRLRDLVEGKKSDTEIHGMVDGYTIMTGLVGFDAQHGVHVELHPVYAMAHLASDVVDGNGNHDQTWEIFFRNWGNEGQCGASQHYLDTTQFTLFLPAVPGAAAVTETSREFAGGGPVITEVSELSPLMQVPATNGTRSGAEITFHIGTPEQRTIVAGELKLHWTVEPGTPKPSPTSTKRRVARATAHETERVLPSTVRLTASQISELRRTFAKPSPPLARTPARRIPFDSPVHRTVAVHEGLLTDHAVPDLDRRDRDKRILASICTMLKRNRTQLKVCDKN